MTLVNFLVGLGDTVILLIIGVDFAVLWGLLAWVLGYIPSVGFWLALVPPVLLAYAEFGIGTALIVFVAYVLINGGVQNLLQPKLMGEGLKIYPMVLILRVRLGLALGRDRRHPGCAVDIVDYGGPGFVLAQQLARQSHAICAGRGVTAGQ